MNLNVLEVSVHESNKTMILITRNKRLSLVNAKSFETCLLCSKVINSVCNLFS